VKTPAELNRISDGPMRYAVVMASAIGRPEAIGVYLRVVVRLVAAEADPARRAALAGSARQTLSSLLAMAGEPLT
jgi:hypothetical protein